MNKSFLTFGAVFAAALLFAGCGSDSGSGASGDDSSSASVSTSSASTDISSAGGASSASVSGSSAAASSSASTAASSASYSGSAESGLSHESLSWNVPSAPTSGTYTSASTDIPVTLSSTGFTVTANTVCATVSGTTLTITCGGTYVLSGTLSNGQIQVNTTDTNSVDLVLNGVYLANTANSPIYVISADKVKIDLADGSVNVLSDAPNYTYIDAADSVPSACVYSKDDMTIKGTGTLYVNGNFNNGIHTKHDLNLNGTPTVYIKAVNHALKGKYSIDATGGTYYLKTTEGDAVQADNETETNKGYVQFEGGTFYIDAAADGVDAYRYVQVNDGTLDIYAGNGSLDTSASHKGLKSSGKVNVVGGKVSVVSQDDAIHAAQVSVTGGALNLASGDDGIQAEYSMTISGGTASVTYCKKPLVAATGLTVSGGTWLGLGGSDSLVAPTAGTQYSVTINLDTAIASGSTVSIQNASGTAIVSAKAGKKISCVFATSADFAAGSYSLVADGTVVKTFTISGYQTLVK